MELSAPVTGAGSTAPSAAPSASGSAGAGASPTAREARALAPRWRTRGEARAEALPGRARDPEPRASAFSETLLCIARYFPTAEDAEYFAKLSQPGARPPSSPNLLRWRLNSSIAIAAWAMQKMASGSQVRACGFLLGSRALPLDRLTESRGVSGLGRSQELGGLLSASTRPAIAGASAAKLRGYVTVAMSRSGVGAATARQTGDGMRRRRRFKEELTSRQSM